MRKMFKAVFATVLVLLFLLLPQAVCAENNDGPDVPAKRTILLYVCGTNLETNNAMASYNLRQILQAKFSEDDDINVIVMTGGANRWHLESKYLAFPDNVNLPKDAVANDDGQSVDPTSQISNIYNQIWEARGADAKIGGEADPNAGKLVLLDGDGITDTKSKKSEEEPVIDPDTLKTFINYGVDNYPAKKYDLILWDHGGGSTGGFGGDDHVMFQTMPVSDIMDALQDNKVTNRGDEDPDNDANFDFIDFDACLMSTIELQLVMADYTNYYIASAETEPGYGQYYTGWLNTLGAEPEKNAFELGKQMVDEYKDFYENGPGKGEAGTLAVVDSKKFLDSGIASPLSQMTALLSDQAKAGLFYDEILSTKESIGYEYMNFFDLGNFASLVSIASSEQTDGEINPDNAYQEAEITKKICSVLQNPEIIYARGTKGTQSTSRIYRDSDGTIQGGNQPTSGVSFYFIDAGNQNSIESYFVYYDEMGKVAEMLPIKDDGRYEFLNAYRNALMDYALLTVTGNAVNRIVGRGTDKSTINYDTVKDYLGGNETDPVVSKYTEWTRVMLRLLEKCGDDAAKGEAAKREWLNNTIRQQADEAVDAENVTASKVKQKNGTGYKVHISKTRNRVIDQVERAISLEIPAAKTYIEDNQLYVDGQPPYGSVNGTLDISSALSPDADVSDIIEWYNGEESDWILDAPEAKWYAIKDADGKLHAAAIAAEDETCFSAAAKIGEGENERHMLLKFTKGDGENILTEITDVTESEGNRPVKPAELTQPISLMPSLLISGRSGGAIVKLYIPTSESEFTLSAANADQISLVYTDISKITDIGDTDEDGTALNSQFSIRDIYGGVTNISDAVNKAEEELIDIELARVRPAVYTGQKLAPEVVYLGKVLQDGTDYTWDLISAGDEDLTKAGDYSLLLTGKGRFTGVEMKTFRIVSEEDAAEALVEQAQAEYEDAKASMDAAREAMDSVKASMDEAVASGDSEALKAAYAKLVNAQNALAEATDELTRAKAVLSEAEQARLEKQISSLEKQIEDLTKELSEAKVIDISNYQVTMKTSLTYTGKALKPAVKVSGVPASAYKASYSDNTKVGTGKVTITATDPNYKGTITKTFKILPKKARIAKVKTGKKKLTVKAKVKVAKTCGTRYQIQYRAKGSSKWKTRTTKKQSLTIKKLKKGKKYQVRIRAFKKAGGKTYYGAWSQTSTSRKVR